MQEEFLNKKTLYLVDRGTGLTVRRDGPSVLIEKKGRAPIRIPVNFVDKVIIWGNIELDAYSLTLFSRHNIPVVILNRDRESSVILPYNHESTDHSKQQRRILGSVILAEKYLKMIKNRRIENERRVINKLFKNLSISIEIEERRYQSLLSKIKPSEFLWDTIKRIIASILQITITGKLISSKLNPHIGIMHKGCDYGLVFDIYHIYEPEADLQTAQFFYSGSCKPSFINQPEITHEEIQIITNRFEMQRMSLYHSLDETISELFSIMRKVTP